jgi:uncharacterized protein
MQCPKCDADMEDVEVCNVIVKRCSSCKGLWFDHAKHVFLKQIEDADVIDTGDPESGKVFDKKGDISCPGCSAPMIKMVVSDQPHIHYESCSQCFSVFFDAGEFTDYVEKDIFSFFKDLMAKER